MGALNGMVRSWLYGRRAHACRRDQSSRRSRLSTRARTASRWRKEATRILSTKRDRLSEVTYDTIAAAITKVDVLEVGRVTKERIG